MVWQATYLFHTYDDNGDGHLEMDEFVTLLEDVREFKTYQV